MKGRGRENTERETGPRVETRGTGARKEGRKDKGEKDKGEREKGEG